MLLNPKLVEQTSSPTDGAANASDASGGRFSCICPTVLISPSYYLLAGSYPHEPEFSPKVPTHEENESVHDPTLFLVAAELG